MKKGSITPSEEIDSVKSYIPKEELVEFIQEWLQIHKKREELAKEGRYLSEEENSRIRPLDTNKVRILDNIIFPALANLTYFFEAMADNQILAKAFENQLEEILDPRNTKHASNLYEYDNTFSSTAFRKNNFARLIAAAIEIPMSKYPEGTTIDDFRLGLMYQLLVVTMDRLYGVIRHEYPFTQLARSFEDDYIKMKGWASLLTRTAKETPKEYDRRLGFSNKYGFQAKETR